MESNRLVYRQQKQNGTSNDDQIEHLQMYSKQCVQSGHYNDDDDQTESSHEQNQPEFGHIDLSVAFIIN